MRRETPVRRIDGGKPGRSRLRNHSDLGAWFSFRLGPGRAERRVRDGASSSVDTGENDYNRKREDCTKIDVFRGRCPPIESDLSGERRLERCSISPLPIGMQATNSPVGLSRTSSRSVCNSPRSTAPPPHTASAQTGTPSQTSSNRRDTRNRSGRAFRSSPRSSCRTSRPL